MKKQIRVLLLDGSARQTLTILHGLKAIKCHVTVLCSTKLDVCYASNLPDRKILKPEASASHEKFVDFLLNEVKSGDYDVLLPVAELTTNKVTENEDKLKQYVRLACAPRSAYINAYDKQRTFETAYAQNVCMPKTRLSSQTVEEYLETVSFPLIIKPRNGVGSIGFHKFNTAEEFWPYIKEHEIDLDTYVLQECVEYEKRLGVIMFVDQHNEICTAYADEVLRWYPLDAGSACLIRSIDHPQVIAESARLLRAMKWQGVAALSFMVDIHTGEAKLLEINGRIPASIRLSAQCGFNVAKQLVQMAYDMDVTKYPKNTAFGLMTRHTHADIPWFLKSKDRFRFKPSWFSWKHTKDIVWWKGDPLPFFAYTLQKLLSYKTIMKKRQH